MRARVSRVWNAVLHELDAFFRHSEGTEAAKKRRERTKFVFVSNPSSVVPPIHPQPHCRPIM